MSSLIISWTSIKVTGIPKRSAEDTVLVASNAAGEKTTIPVPKGTNLVIDAPGLHYNRMSSVAGPVISLLNTSISSVLE